LKKEIEFLDSFRADPSVIPSVINELINRLKQAEYHPDEIDEIVLAVDEAVTNAVLNTIEKTRKTRISNEHPDRRDITVGYTITRKFFNATVIDQGPGLDIYNVLQSLPDSGSDSYISQIMNYVSKSEKKKIRVRINGREIPVSLTGTGQGLKIIMKFMDSVTIDLIDKKEILSSSVTEHTDGTILNMKRKRRLK